MSSTDMQSSKGSEERPFRQANGLKRLAQVINAYSSQEQALAEALKVVAEVMQVEKCLLMRHDSRNTKLVPVSPPYGFQQNELDQLHVILVDNFDASKTDCWVFNRAFYEGRPAYSNGPHSFSAPDNASTKNILTVKNALVVPVYIEGQVQGVCAAMNRNGEPFGEEDCELLAALASIMATLLKNLTLINRLEGAQRRHLAVLDAAVDGFIEVNRDFRITLFSKGAESLTGWKAEEAMGHTCSEVLLPHTPSGDLLCHTCPLKRSFRLGTSVPNIETLVRTHDGEDNWVSCSYNVVTDEQGGLASGVIAVKDIYRIKALTDELRQQIQQQESLLGVINAINGISSIEEIYSKALGEVANAINFDLGMIHSIREDGELELMAISEPEPEPARPVAHTDSRANFLPEPDDDPSLQNPIANFEPELVEDIEYRRQTRQRRSDSNPVLSGRSYTNHATHLHKVAHDCEALRQNEPYMAVNLPGKEVCGVLEGFQQIQSHLCVPIKTQDHTYGVLHLASHHPYAFWGSDFALALSICKQIAVAAERAHLFEEVDRLARTDPLTKLYNKREFWDRIDREMKRAERQRRPLSLVVIDLDRLKWYNDFYGHSHGDILLSHIGKLILDKCRNTDVAFRYGGDELCLLLPDTGPREAYMVAERIRQSAIELQIVIGDDVIIGDEEESRVTMSIGVASFPNDARTGVELFENADSAMYRAKETGKNRSVVYDPAVDINKLNYRRRVRPSEYVDARLKPASPNPAPVPPPLLSGGQQMAVPFNLNSENLNNFNVNLEESIIIEAAFSRTGHTQELGSSEIGAERKTRPDEIE